MAQTLRKKCLTAIQKLARISAADEYGMVQCVSCDKRLHWKEADGGHYIAKGSSSYWALEIENVHPQCKKCNLSEGGNFENYYPYMVEMYGEAGIEELRQLSKTTKHYSITDLLEIEREYKEKISGLSS